MGLIIAGKKHQTRVEPQQLLAAPVLKVDDRLDISADRAVFSLD